MSNRGFDGTALILVALMAYSCGKNTGKLRERESFKKDALVEVSRQRAPLQVDLGRKYQSYPVNGTNTSLESLQRGSDALGRVETYILRRGDNAYKEKQ